MIRDVSRDRLPAGAMWNILDYIPAEIDAPVAKRGGWKYASPNLNEVVSGGATRVSHVVYAPFSSGGQLLAVTWDAADSTARLAVIVSESNAADKGEITSGAFPWFTFFRNNLIITTGSAAYIYNGSTLNTLPGSPPSANFCCTYKDRLVFARSGGAPQRIWFSGPGDAQSWDTTSGWIDTTGEVVGIWALRNSILVWHPSSLERIIGSIPPPGSDMYVQPVDPGGTSGLGIVTDRLAYSLAGTDEFVCFANASGAYMTDGTSIIDLTKRGGMKSYWQSLTGSTSTLRIAGGFFRGYYFISVRNSSTTFRDAFAVNLNTYSWVRLSNITANGFTTRNLGIPEMYWADFSEARVNTMSDIFNPTSDNKGDADGTPVTPVVETPFYLLGQSKGRAKRGQLTYDIRDAGSDNPTLTVSAVYSPESSSYTTLKSGIAETSAITKAEFAINKAAYGVGLKVAQANASAQTRLYALAVDAHPREDSRLN